MIVLDLFCDWLLLGVVCHIVNDFVFTLLLSFCCGFVVPFRFWVWLDLFCVWMFDFILLRLVVSLLVVCLVYFGFDCFDVCYLDYLD